MTPPADLFSLASASIPQEQLELFAMLAKAEGVTIEEWILTACQVRAVAFFGESQTTILGNKDRDEFIAMLEAKPAPNEALRKARLQYLETPR